MAVALVERVMVLLDSRRRDDGSDAITDAVIATPVPDADDAAIAAVTGLRAASHGAPSLAG